MGLGGFLQVDVESDQIFCCLGHTTLRELLFDTLNLVQYKLYQTSVLYQTEHLGFCWLKQNWMQCLTDNILQRKDGKQKLLEDCYIWLTDTDEFAMFDWYNFEENSWVIQSQNVLGAL